MNDDTATLKTLRERIERRHREALSALDLLSKYFEENSVRIGGNGSAPSTSNRAMQSGSQRQQIALAIKEYKSVPQIAKATGLTQVAVRGCLYAQDFAKKVEKKKMQKKLHFRMRRESG